MRPRLMCAMPPSHFRRPSRETVVAELDKQEVGELLSRVGYDPDGSGSLDEEELAAVYLEMGSGDAVDLPEFEEWWKRQPKAMLALLQFPELTPPFEIDKDWTSKHLKKTIVDPDDRALDEITFAAFEKWWQERLNGGQGAGARVLLSECAKHAWDHAKQVPTVEDEPEPEPEATEAETQLEIFKKRKKKQKKEMKRLDDSLWGHVVQYEILVKTSDVRGAGTDANVHVIMYGADADSGEIPLHIESDSGDKFERDALDVFVVNCLWIGDIKRLRIGHDAQGLGSGWHLERVIVHDCLARSYFFPCNQWLDIGFKTKKKQLFRELVPLEESAKEQNYTPMGGPALITELTVYELKVFTGDLPVRAACSAHKAAVHRSCQHMY